MENISTVLKYCCGECGFSAALTDSDYCIELYLNNAGLLNDDYPCLC